jgi:hypothetical protein
MAERIRKPSALFGLAGCCLALAAGCGSERDSSVTKPSPSIRTPAAKGSPDRSRSAAQGSIERVRPHDAHPRPTQLILALPQLGRLRARCDASTRRYLVSYVPSPLRSESVRASAGGKTVVANAPTRLFLSFPAPRRKVGREVVRQTPAIALRLDSSHEPFEVLAQVHLRLAESRDGTGRCVATTLRVRLSTRYH